MKLHLLTAILLTASSLTCTWAQTPAKNQNYSHLEVESVDKSQRTVPDSIVKLDANGDKMAQIIVESPLDNLVFENGGLYKINNTPSVTKRQRGNLIQYTIDFLQDYDRIDVKHRDFVGTTIMLGSKAKPGEIWRVKILPVEAEEIETATVDDRDYKRPVKLKTDNFSKVYVDEQLVVESNSSRNAVIRLEEGKHYIHSQYGNGKKYQQSIDVKKDNQEVDIRYGGEVDVTNAKNVSFTTYSNPKPMLMYHEGRTYVYDNLYGDYTLHAESNGTMVSKSVSKDFKIGSRGSKTFRVDEMVPYFFLMYSGTISEPLGFSMGVCKKWGWNLTFTSNVEEDEEDMQMSFTTGPMWRVYRKFYLIAEGGAVNYLKDEWAGEASLKFMFRFRSFAIGLGYTKLFTDDIDSDLLNFSIGLAF